MDKFGRSLPTSSLQKEVKFMQNPTTLTLTKDGDYNVRDHRLCNVKQPTEDSDASTKSYVDYVAEQQLRDFIKTLNVHVEKLEKEVTMTNQRIDKVLDNEILFQGEFTALKKNITMLQNDLLSHQAHINSFKSSFEKLETSLKNYTDSLTKTTLKSVRDEVERLEKGKADNLKLIDSKLKELRQTHDEAVANLITVTNNRRKKDLQEIKKINDEIVKMKKNIETLGMDSGSDINFDDGILTITDIKPSVKK
jgi:chromosome segregation ATPase